MNGSRILAIIPARGGSKGVPGKNLKELAGIPLVDHSILFARDSGVFDHIMVTSDDEAICDRARIHRVTPVRRPAHLAGDNSLVVDAMIHCLDTLKQEHDMPDSLFLLEPTAPLRDRRDLIKAVEALESGYDSVASFCETEPPAGRIWLISDHKVRPLMEGADPFLPRQQQVPGYRLTGQYYGFQYHLFADPPATLPLEGRIFPLITDSERAIDIDREIDFQMAEYLIISKEKTP